MKFERNTSIAVLLNLFLSMVIVSFSPRFDIVTFFAFFILHLFLFLYLSLENRRKEEEIDGEIETTYELLHRIDDEVSSYQVEDSSFGKLKDEMSKIVSENKRLSRESQRNQEILREYTEDIAHQIKTPVTGSLLLLDLMEEDSENRVEYVDRLKNSLQRLEQLVDILLKLAAIDANVMPFQKDSVSMGELVEEIIEELDIFFQDEAKISTIGDDFTLVCDRRWTFEAIFNIAKNGIEHSPGGEIEIELRETNIFQSVFIKDYGVPMSDKMLENALLRFHKNNVDGRGFGIGLPMAKTILTRQNGDLLYHRGKSSNSFELRFYK